MVFLLLATISGLYGDNGKEHGNYYNMLGLYWGNIGIMENTTETITMITIAVVVYYPTACPKGPGTQTIGSLQRGYRGIYVDIWGL